MTGTVDLTPVSRVYLYGARTWGIADLRFFFGTAVLPSTLTSFRTSVNANQLGVTSASIGTLNLSGAITQMYPGNMARALGARFNSVSVVGGASVGGALACSSTLSVGGGARIGGDVSVQGFVAVTGPISSANEQLATVGQTGLIGSVSRAGVQVNSFPTDQASTYRLDTTTHSTGAAIPFTYSTGVFTFTERLVLQIATWFHFFAHTNNGSYTIRLMRNGGTVVVDLGSFAGGGTRLITRSASLIVDAGDTLAVNFFQTADAYVSLIASRVTFSTVPIANIGNVATSLALDVRGALSVSGRLSVAGSVALPEAQHVNIGAVTLSSLMTGPPVTASQDDSSGGGLNYYALPAYDSPLFFAGTLISASHNESEAHGPLGTSRWCDLTPWAADVDRFDVWWQISFAEPRSVADFGWTPMAAPASFTQAPTYPSAPKQFALQYSADGGAFTTIQTFIASLPFDGQSLVYALDADKRVLARYWRIQILQILDPAASFIGAAITRLTFTFVEASHFILSNGVTRTFAPKGSPVYSPSPTIYRPFSLVGGTITIEHDCIMTVCQSANFSLATIGTSLMIQAVISGRARRITSYYPPSTVANQVVSVSVGLTERFSTGNTTIHFTGVSHGGDAVAGAWDNIQITATSLWYLRQ